MILLIKEFKQIFRNRAMLPIIFLMPVVQLLILANAATFEIKDLRLFIVDKDMSDYSRDLISKFQSSKYFKITGTSFNSADAESELMNGTSDLYIEVPGNFEKYLIKEISTGKPTQKILISINAIDGTKAGLATVYSNSVILDYNRQFLQSFTSVLPDASQIIRLRQIGITYSTLHISLKCLY